MVYYPLHTLHNERATFPIAHTTTYIFLMMFNLFSGETTFYIPYMLMLGLSVTSIFLHLMLPDNKGKAFPTTIQEAEQLSINTSQISEEKLVT